MASDPSGPAPDSTSDEHCREPAGAAPPTVRDEIPVPRVEPKWPLVLGIIAVIFGGGGVLIYAWGILSMLLMRDFFQAGAMLPEKFTLLNIASSALNLIPAALLLPAGIGLIRWRRWGVRLTKLWAAVKIPLAVVAAWLSYMLQEAMLSSISQQGPGMPGFSQMRGVMLAFAVGFPLLWGWALPVFMLIFLSRPRVREQVADWL